MVSLTKFVIRSLEFATRLLPARKPKHLLTGKHGEIEAYPQSIGASGGTSYRSLADTFVASPATVHRRAAST